jgi:streptogramin lyase
VRKPVQPVTITSDPPGAEVRVGDQTVTTPGTVTLKRNEDYTVRVSKEGYYDNVATLRHRESAWLAGNLLWDLPTTGLLMFLTQGQGGLIILGPGSICDRLTGAGYTLTPEKVELVLDRRPPSAEGGNAARLRPHVIKEMTFPAPVETLLAGAGSVWVVHHEARFLTSKPVISRIDPHTNEVTATFPIPVGSGHLVVGQGALWFTTLEFFPTRCTLCKLDLETRQVVARLPLPAEAARLAEGEGAIWVLIGHQEKRGLALVPTGLEVLKVDPQTAQVSAVKRLGQDVWGQRTVAHAASSDIAVGSGGVWVTNAAVSQVVRLDPQTLEVAATIPVGQRVRKVAAGDDAVWVFGRALEPKEDPPAQVTRVDPLTNQAARPVFDGGLTAEHYGLQPARAVGRGAVWFLDGEDGTLHWVDAATGSVTGEPLPLGPAFKHGGSPSGNVIAAEGSVWVAGGKQLVRVAPE